MKQSACIRLRGSGPGNPGENSEDAMLDEADDEEACAALLQAEQQHMEGDQNSGADAQSAAAPTASPRRQARKRKMELSPREHRAQDGKLARRQLADGQELAGLRLRQVATSPYNYNCLAFSCLMAAGQIAPTSSAQEAARHRSDLERLYTHEEVMRQLPAEADSCLSGNAHWWAGQTSENLTRILEEEDFMGEAHVHGFVNRMRRDVVVLDVRSPLLDIHHYQPGYSAQRQISKRTAHNRGSAH